MTAAPGHAPGALEGTASAPALLEVDDLFVQFPVRRGLGDRVARRPAGQVHAVDGVSLTLQRGEMLAIVGESGCGKTTTLGSILRVVDPSSGSVRFDGIELSGLPARKMRPLRRRIQMIYQDPYESLDPRFRVGRTVEEPLLVHGVGGGRAERLERVSHALERAGLDPPALYIDRFPHELSGGQRQRVAIAAALVLGPDLLLADEPVSMLDVSIRASILSLLAGLRDAERMAVIMITHDLATAAHFADRICVMYLGRIVEEGPAAAVIGSPQHPYTQALLSLAPEPGSRRPGQRRLLSGEIPDSVHLPIGCRFHPRCPRCEPRCREADPTLSEWADPGREHHAACLLLAEPRQDGRAG